MNKLDYIGANELIYNTDNENGIYSGGFSVNSVMMKAGMSPIMTLNTSQKGGTNKVSDLFNDLVIPNWVLSYNDKMVGGEYKENNEKENCDDEVDDDLYDKLLGLVKEDSNKIKPITKKRKTRKPIIFKKNVTKKNIKTNKIS